MLNFAARFTLPLDNLFKEVARSIITTQKYQLNSEEEKKLLKED